MTQLKTRNLATKDVDALIALEQQQWNGDQLPTMETLVKRIESNPDWCIGVFCETTGRAIASAFLIPVNAEQMRNSKTWESCTKLTVKTSEKSIALFGISLTSINPKAGQAIFEYLLPRALKAGYKEVYLGSPIPGFSKAKTKNNDLTAEEYVHKKRSCGKRPKDPQLLYYYNHGCHDIISVCENYFPHEPSLNYGVIVRGHLPLSEFNIIWHFVPLSTLNALSNFFFSLLRIPRKLPTRIRLRSPIEVSW